MDATDAMDKIMLQNLRILLWRMVTDNIRSLHRGNNGTGCYNMQTIDHLIGKYLNNGVMS